MKTNYNSQSEVIPVINGVLYPDERIERYIIRTDESGCRTVSKDGADADIPPENIVETTNYVNDECVCEDIDVRFTCGEGSYGGDGFVLAESDKSAQMMWLISFDDSNPFVKLERNGGFLSVTNNCGEVWCINITDIYNIKISIEKQSRYVV